MSSQPLVKILRGQWRGLGDTGQGLGLIFDFNFRQYLHHFKGARLAVLMAISLHADEQGQAYPSYDLLQKETGYQRDTIARALDDLTKMVVEGSRVLLRYRLRDEQGQYTGSNRYIIFPTPDEVTQYGSSEPELENQTLVVLEPELENPEVVFSDSNINHNLTESKEQVLNAPGFTAGYMGAQVKNPRAALALAKYEQRQAEQAQDLSQWPEDCRPWVEVLAGLWGLPVPERPRSGKGGQYAEWIREIRGLAAACGEYGTNVLYQVHGDYMTESVKAGGPPYIVARPAALTRAATGKAAWLRSANKSPQVLAAQQASQAVKQAGQAVANLADGFNPRVAAEQKKQQMIAEGTWPLQ